MKLRKLFSLIAVVVVAVVLAKVPTAFATVWTMPSGLANGPTVSYKVSGGLYNRGGYAGFGSCGGR